MSAEGQAPHNLKWEWVHYILLQSAWVRIKRLCHFNFRCFARRKRCGDEFFRRMLLGYARSVCDEYYFWNLNNQVSEHNSSYYNNNVVKAFTDRKPRVNVGKGANKKEGRREASNNSTRLPINPVPEIGGRLGRESNHASVGIKETTDADRLGIEINQPAIFPIRNGTKYLMPKSLHRQTVTKFHFNIICSLFCPADFED